MISYDYRNVMASRVGAGHGLTDDEVDREISRTGEICRHFAEGDARGEFGFARLPFSEEAARKVAQFAAEKRGLFRNFVQIGIGGSALGATAIHTALARRFHNEAASLGRGPGPRFYVLDNVDPEETRALFDLLDPKETIFHVVTKSGDTTETMAGFQIAVDRLRRAMDGGWKRHVVFTTDPEKGFLRKLAQDEGIAAFEIPPAVGGRFSVLTPVGLLPAAMLGVDVLELLAGAREMHGSCSRAEARRNPGYLFALAAHLLDVKRGKRIHVMMPYARALRDVADWFRQLWGESLGKTPQVGPTPMFSLGATDQHSQIQLFNEGPNDKYVIFLECVKHRQDETIPAVFDKGAPCAFLQGSTVSRVISAMKAGTEQALVQNRRPNATIRLPEVTARSLGALFFLLEAATLFAGRLYGVNPFDQPGVEAGKKAAFALLGRPGYPPPPADAPDERYVIS